VNFNFLLALAWIIGVIMGIVFFWLYCRPQIQWLDRTLDEILFGDNWRDTPFVKSVFYRALKNEHAGRDADLLAQILGAAANVLRIWNRDATIFINSISTRRTTGEKEWLRKHDPDELKRRYPEEPNK